jgi:metal-dependent amidase/aminoacylase/carboxypeptidase family protein
MLAVGKARLLFATVLLSLGAVFTGGCADETIPPRPSGEATTGPSTGETPADTPSGQTTPEPSAADSMPGSPSLETRIVEQTDSIYAEAVRIRRDLHMHPEVAGSEVRTARIVADWLRTTGLEVRTGVGGHGVVGILRGAKDGPVVAYRADMDALPQEIEEQVPFTSATPGVSHACGHDVHTAVGLGIARVLSSFRAELPGTVVFLFQPAEETVEGAMKMIADGALDDPAPEAIFAVHVAPVESGTIVTNPGVGLPGIEQFNIKMTAAGDVEPADLEAAASRLAESIGAIGTVQYPEGPEEWQSQVAALLDRDTSLKSFILALAWLNEPASPDERAVGGFFKCSGASEYNRAKARLQELISELESAGIASEIQMEKVLADMICDERLATWAIEPLQAVLGQGAVLRAHASLPFFGEDFAYFLQQTPGVMFYLGASSAEDGIVALPHSPGFAVDEKAIRAGIQGMSSVIVHYLLSPPTTQGFAM